MRESDLDPAAAHSSADRDHRTDDLIDRVRRLLEQERVGDALELLNALHPADQGDVLVDLPSSSRQEILDELPPEDTADIFEHLTGDEAAQVSEQLDTEHLAGRAGRNGPRRRGRRAPQHPRLSPQPHPRRDGRVRCRRAPARISRRVRPAGSWTPMPRSPGLGRPQATPSTSSAYAPRQSRRQSCPSSTSAAGSSVASTS